MTAVILAAGLGSRYGGLKQLDPVGPNGEFIIDYSVYDCIRAGFDKIVFIIKEENLEIFEESIGSRISGNVEIEYAFQNGDDLPDGFSCPACFFHSASDGTLDAVGSHCTDTKLGKHLGIFFRTQGARIIRGKREGV